MLMQMMRRIVTLSLLFALGQAAPARAAAPPAVLMIADELPAMQVLADELAARARLKSVIVTPDQVPPLNVKSTVIVYIHKNLAEPLEIALLDHARAGGKLILLHHTISSGKRTNKYLFEALGIVLPTGEVTAGGYKYIDDTTFDLFNVAPKNPITTRKVKYPKRLSAPAADAFTMAKTEIYLNHQLVGPRTLLLGIHWTDDSGKLYVQETAGWTKPLGKGRLFYFMPGHYPDDFKNPLYAQILTNAVTAR
jgi:hypothetical protein